MKKEFSRSSVYRDIVLHPNFNPRIIAQSLELAYANDPKDVVNTVLNNLQSPRALWEHIVEYELEDAAIHVLLVLFTFAGSVTIETLEEAWYAYCATLHLSDEPREFRKALDTLEDTMIRITPRHNGVFLSYHNPSIRDYMHEYVAGQHATVKHLLASVTKFSRIANLWTLANGWKGAELLAQLSRNSTLVEAGIIRLFDQHDEQDLSDWTWRATIALRISSMLDLDGVVQVVMNKFAGNWTEEIWDRRDLVSVVQAVAICKHPVACRERERIVTQAANWLTNDLSTWEDATDAQQLLDELGIAPYWALTNVEYSIDRLIEEEMDAWVHGSRKDINWRELEEMVDIIDAKYETPDSVFPGYSKAVQALEHHKNTLDVPKNIMWAEEELDQTYEDDENDIRNIMRHLAID
ncbi:hypothetical protein [Actinophytocola sp.]|uniref:hypothetical protein n=1 Tax=Actinophytocola sp. TaxID=1872138 RepID=UPI00389A7CCD